MPGRSQTLYLMEMLMAGYYLRFIEAIQSAYTTFSAFLTRYITAIMWLTLLGYCMRGGYCANCGT